MSNIEELSLGCTGAELVSKINEIVEALNAISPATSYNDLSDKPSINGHTLIGAKTTGDLDIAMADAVDYDDQMDVIGTKVEISEAQTAATAAATAAAQALVNSKIPSDPSDVIEVTMLNEEAFMYIIGPEGLRKVSLKNLTKNTALDLTTKKVLGDNQSQRVIPLSGDKNNNNVNFRADTAFATGSSNLFYNGQRLVNGVDYEETNNRTITMITHVPGSNDSLILIAIPQ